MLDAFAPLLFVTIINGRSGALQTSATFKQCYTPSLKKQKMHAPRMHISETSRDFKVDFVVATVTLTN